MRSGSLTALGAAAVVAGLAGCGGTFSGSTAGEGGPGLTQEIIFQPVVADRQDHTATVLDTGNVLIAGGRAQQGFVATAEIFRRVGFFFATSTAMVVARADHTATRLANDLVLFAGGESQNGIEATTERYDRRTDLFTPGPTLQAARRFHTATRVDVPKDAVVLVGGEDGAGQPVGVIERVDPTGQTVQSIGAGLAFPRSRHAAVYFLPQDEVHVIGGRVAGGGVTETIEIVNPATGAVRFARGRLLIARRDHAAVPLADGRVLVVGGVDGTGAPIAIAELYTPEFEVSTGAGNPLLTARANPVAVRLAADGRVLVTGDGAQTELYSTRRSSFLQGTSLNTPRARHTLTELNGQVLVFGGAGPQDLAELFIGN